MCIFFPEHVYDIGSFYVSQQKRKRGVFEALNSLAIKQAMPARNASMGGGIAQPCIPPLAHACLSTMHVPPWASSPQASPGRTHSLLCSSDPPPPSGSSQDFLFFCLWKASKKRPSSPQVICSWESLKRVLPDQGSLPCSCSLC